MANVLESAASGTGLEAELRPGQFTIPSHAHTFCSLSTFLLLNLAAHWHRPMSYSDKPWGNYQNIFQSQLSQFSDAPTLFLVPWRFTQSVLFLMNNFCSVNYVELCLFYFFFFFGYLVNVCNWQKLTHIREKTIMLAPPWGLARQRWYWKTTGTLKGLFPNNEHSISFFQSLCT